MVHILQILCPKRHCLFAIPYESENTTAPEAMSAAERAFNEHSINPWCGICGSKDLRMEIGVTRFKTLKEAAPALLENQAAQMATRQQIDLARN
jgi:hypothetical protein